MTPFNQHELLFAVWLLVAAVLHRNDKASRMPFWALIMAGINVAQMAASIFSP